MKHFTSWYLAAVLLLSLSSPVHATIVIPGNYTNSAQGTAPTSAQSFDAPVVASILDNISGTFYVGLNYQVQNDAFTTNEAGMGFIIASADRLDYNVTATFHALANTTDDLAVFNNSAIASMALATNEFAFTPTLFFVVNTTNDDNQEIVYAAKLPTGSPKTDTGENSSGASDIFDGTNLSANPTGGIAAIAAGHSADLTPQGTVFAAVTDNSNEYSTTVPQTAPTVPFGVNNSGIALITFDGTTLFGTNDDPLGSLIFQETIFVNNTSAEFTGSTAALTIPSTTTGGTGQVVMYWDAFFNQAYLGMTVQSGRDNKALSVIIVRRTGNSSVSITPILDNYAAISDTHDNIIVDQANNAADTDFANLALNFLKVMHTSTGRDYLIVQGGNGGEAETANNTTANTVYALPLYRPPADVTGDPNRGQLATNNFTLTGAANIGLTKRTDQWAKVGNCALPTLTDTLPANSATLVGDMQVVGDTVYASLASGVDNAGTPSGTGLYWSQAIFDNQGRISSWTQWQRAVPDKSFAPINNADNDDVAPNSGQIANFAIDPVNGKAWLVRGNVDNATYNPQARRQVVATHWTGPTNIQSLPGALNKALSKGTFSVLDLNQATRYLQRLTTSRYALFGGLGKVVFARISIAEDDPASCNTPDRVLTNEYQSASNPQLFNPENFLVTTLPDSCAGIRALGYTNQEEDNYFLAGNDDGLFVFAPQSGPFAASSLGALDTAPFSDGAWQQVSGITNATITAIRNVGTSRAYVLARDKTTKGPPADKVYLIDLTAYPPNPIIIATSGTTAGGSDLSNATVFTGLAVIPIDTDNVQPNPHTPNNERVVLASNNGMYESTIGSVITDQSTAEWTLSPLDSEGVSYTNLVPLPISAPATIWPLSLVRNPNCPTLFNQTSIDQVGSDTSDDTTPDTLAITPEKYDSSAPDPIFQTLYPMTNFWTDGARRYFIGIWPNDPAYRTRISLIPYETPYWRVYPPAAPLQDTLVNSIARYYWVQEIGASGLVLAGNNQGVMSLG